MSMYFPSSDSSSIGSNIKSNSTDLESSSAASSSQQLATWSGVGLTIPSPDEQQANRTIFQKFCDKAYATFLGVPQTLLRMYHSITGWADPEVLKTRSARINALFSGNKKIAELEYQKLEAQKRRDNFLVLGAEIKISNLKKAIALERGDHEVAEAYRNAAVSFEKEFSLLQKQAEELEKGDTSGVAEIYARAAEASHHAAKAYGEQAVVLEREDHGVAEAYRNAAVSFEKEFLFLKQQAEELKKGDTSGMAGIYARAAEASQYAAKAYGEQAVRLPQYVEDLSIPQCYAYIAQNYAYQADSLHKKAKVFGDTQDINKQTELAKIYEQSAQANRAAAQAYEAQAVALEREDHGVAQVYGNAAVSFEKEFLFLKQQAEELKKGDTSGIAGIYEQTAKASQMLGEMYLKKTGYLLSGSNNQICDRIIEASNYEVSYFQHRYRIWVSKESEEGVRAALLAYNQCAIETIRKAREHDLAIINTPSNQSLLEDPEQSESNFFQEAMSLGEKVEAMLFIHLQMIENSDNAQKEQTSEISKQLYSKANAFRLEQFEALENNDLTSVEEKKKMAINSEKEAYHGSFGGVDPISSTYEITRKIFGDDEKYDAFEAERSRLFRLPRNAQTPQKISSPITTEETSEKSHHLDLSSDSDDEEESRR